MNIKEKIEKLSYELTKSLKKIEYLLEYETKNTTQKEHYKKLYKEGILYSAMLIEFNDNQEKISKDYIKYEFENIVAFCRKISQINKKDLPF